jgi:hypothetical protein
MSVLGRPDLVDLRTLTEAWRIRRDTEGLPVIPGRRGNVSAHDLATLHVYVHGRHYLLKLLRVLPAAWRRHQIGDDEANLLAPVADLDLACRTVRAYRRRRLGAGVIFKEGLTVRGLTTAASIWITAAIGILIGVGFYFAAIVGAAATLAVLAAFRFLERRLPTEYYAHHSVTFERKAVMAEDDLRRLIGDHGFSVANLSYRLIGADTLFEYVMVIKSRDRRDSEALSQHLCRLPEVLEFRIEPRGD